MNRLAILLLLICGCCGCHDGTADYAVAKVREVDQEVDDLRYKLAASNARIDKLEQSVPRWWKYVNDQHGEHSVVADGKVDLPAALKDAGQLVMHLGHSREEIVAFVTSHFDAIWEHRVHLIGVDPLKVLIRKDISDDVNKLLEP
jgi:hypothetical protein